MYGKIFESIFDSTLAAEGGWMPTYIFMSMVVLADKFGVVDVAPKALYRRLGFSDFDSKIAYEEFLAALGYLQEEDPSSRSSKEAGRRIIPISQLDDVEGNRGFVIVNYEHYRDKGGSIEQRRAQDAERKRRQRRRQNKDLDEKQAKCHVTVTDGHGMSAHTDIDTDTDINNSLSADARLPTFSEHPDAAFNGRKAPPDFEVPDEMIEAMVQETGLSRREIGLATVRFKDHCYERTSFDWFGRWRNWIRNERPRANGPVAGRRKPTYGEQLDADMAAKGWN